MVARKYTQPPQGKNVPPPKKVVVDATGLVAGRLASVLAKRLLANEEVHVVNAEKAIITGTPDSIMANYWFKRNVGTRRKGPFYPRVPHLMMKRTVRGMLKYQESPRHRAAYKRLKCYIGVPEDLASMQAETIDRAKPKTAFRSMTLGQIAKGLGAKF